MEKMTKKEKLGLLVFIIIIISILVIQTIRVEKIDNGEIILVNQSEMT